MASGWQRRGMRWAIGLAAAPVAVVNLLLLAERFFPEDSGPQPKGDMLIDGVVLHYDASDGGTAVIAEVRGIRTFPGETREVLYHGREPFEPGDFERLARGGATGRIAPDGTALSWLASKERGDRTGPGRVRAAAREAPALEPRGFLASRVVFDAGRALALTGYTASSARGSLSEFDVVNGTSRIVAPNISPGGFAVLTSGRTFAIRRPYNAMAGEAMILGRAGESFAGAISTEVDWDGPMPAFRVGSDRRSVVMRLAPDAQGRRALVRWKDGVTGLAKIADDVAAWTLDREDRAWWVSADGRALSVFRDGATTRIGEAVGADAVSVHPLPSGEGAWLVLADRPCAKEWRDRDPQDVDATHGRAPTEIPSIFGDVFDGTKPGETSGCLRLVTTGRGPRPPTVSTLRKVYAPTTGWPIALAGPIHGGPSLLALGDPGRYVAIDEGNVLDVAFSPDGRFAGARVRNGDAEHGGERIVFLDLERGTSRVLAEGAPESLMSWHGDALLYVWRNRWWRMDPRNGLYRYRPD